MSKKEWLVQVDNKVARGVLCGVPQSLICERLLFASIGNYKPGENKVAVEFDVNHIIKGKTGEYQKKRIDGLCTKMFGCHIVERVDGGTWRTAVFKKMFVDEKTRKITAMFNEEILPYIAGLKSEFTMIPLESYLGLSTKYSAILYRLLKSYSGFGKGIPIKLSAENLIESLGVPESVGKDSWRFKNKVLTPAIEEINKVMDITVSYKPVKKERSVARYDFHIELKESSLEAVEKRKAKSYYAKNPSAAKTKKVDAALDNAEKALDYMSMTGEIKEFLDGLV